VPSLVKRSHGLGTGTTDCFGADHDDESNWLTNRGYARIPQADPALRNTARTSPRRSYWASINPTFTLKEILKEMSPIGETESDDIAAR